MSSMQAVTVSMNVLDDVCLRCNEIRQIWEVRRTQSPSDSLKGSWDVPIRMVFFQIFRVQCSYRPAACFDHTRLTSSQRCSAHKDMVLYEFNKRSLPYRLCFLRFRRLVLSSTTWHSCILRQSWVFRIFLALVVFLGASGNARISTPIAKALFI